ncbi:unnamed protein product [Prorocentrum cordatum]|uniref:C3H1-type domain-containing protein n=1 Tax=Prorocentrum cordatum TaxID=2364126 RepID=A0ABN9VQL9_9DINO|nr:unnamed protein product [Polarella glacialis]|mmetsp:Transcript_127758/g.342865  ORF Transcript_127758/g.342865 Transcript_127758/m.342865 type:complete len:328 (-) Transcript_127758:242-1225(-)
MYSETMRALRRATNANVKHAVAHVDDQPEVRVTNRLVADVLLRAKVGSLPQADVASASQSSQSATGMVPRVDDGGDPEGDTVDQDGLADAIGGPGLADAEGTPAELRGQRRVDALAGVVENPVGPEVTPPAEDDLPRTLLVEGAPALPPGLADPYESACHNNAGSMGHPEMCVRPCLYFSQGQCTNGNECRFCHYQHPTRPVHLGRQHRKTLEGASVAQCFTISLPVLEQKLATLGLPTDTLWAHASQCAAQGGGGAAEAGGKVKARELRTLEKAFGALSLRSLLVVLQRKTGAQASREKALLDTVLKKLREVGYLVDIGEEVPRDD